MAIDVTKGENRDSRQTLLLKISARSQGSTARFEETGGATATKRLPDISLYAQQLVPLQGTVVRSIEFRTRDDITAVDFLIALLRIATFGTARTGRLIFES